VKKTTIRGRLDGEARDLGMGQGISRRDFLNGIAIGTASTALASAWPGLAMAAADVQQGDAPYPPALTGMRGTHDGAFEAGHQLRDGAGWAAQRSGESYDLVVVGAGLSGLAAAWFFRQSAGPQARILILDNHDDFGGHAKRNEFSHKGKTILVNGGTLNLEEPSHYSPMAMGMLRELGIDVERYQLQSESARNYHRNQGLNAATFFDRETFGEDRLVARPPMMAWEDFLARTPMSARVQQDIARLYNASAQQDVMPGLSDEEKKARLASISYRDYLIDYMGVDPAAIAFFQARPHFRFYVGPEEVPALFCWQMNYPGFQGLNLRPSPAVGPLAHIAGAQVGREPGLREDSVYFPDGNATVARMIVRDLIPDAMPGHSLEDAVPARMDYTRLDRDGAAARIRLSSTVVNVSHVGNSESASEVEVSYVRDGQAVSVRAGQCILACWHTTIPYLCPELPATQREALAYGIKAPRVYTNVLLDNARAFVNLGVRSVDAPGGYHSSSSLQMPLSVGSYQGARDVDDPIVLRMHRAPCAPGRPRREQHRIGRMELLTTNFATFEHEIRDQLNRMLGEGGFDAARDIAGITVNRWPHGNAYAYGTLSDPPHWALHATDDRPCVIARQPFGRISIANSDAAASPFTDAAIDEAHRAVREVLARRAGH